jgi:lipid-binding SYLF domain-containing protein
MNPKIAMNWKQALLACGALLIGVAVATASFAESKDKIDEHVSHALKRFYALSPKHQELANKAAGMLIFPRITKGGVGIAGEYGEGVLQVNGKTVDYYSVGGGSVGLTLGIAEHSEIIMFMTQDALDKFTQSKGWTIGADAAVTVVSKGAGGQYDSETLKKPILAFAFHGKGLIGDLSLEGSKITKLSK